MIKINLFFIDKAKKSQLTTIIKCNLPLRTILLPLFHNIFMLAEIEKLAFFSIQIIKSHPTLKKRKRNLNVSNFFKRKIDCDFTKSLRIIFFIC